MRLSAATIPTVILAAALALAAAGCSSGGPHSSGRDAGVTSVHNGVTATIPAGWHRVRLIDLPGAEVPLEIASFMARGGVTTICDPHRIAAQIPAGGALVQLLQDSGVERHGAGAVSQTNEREIHRYPVLRKPFHLEGLGSHECGEAYNLWFRKGGRLFQLRVWSAPRGLSSTVRAQIERLMDGLYVKPAQPPIARPPLARRTVGVAALRAAILRGVAADFAAGTGVGPPHFEHLVSLK